MIPAKAPGLLCAILLASFTPLHAAVAAPGDDEIPTMLRERIERDEMGVGISVGVVDGHGGRSFSYGRMEAAGHRDVDGDTLFEIGSITKIFTTLLLQDMADRGEVKLDDPIGKFLPASVKTPSFKGRQITLVDLATHTSGLPRVPTFGTWYLLWHRNNPYAGFRVKQLYAFLSQYELPREPGVTFEYSNLGMELLGQVLSVRAGTNYEALVVDRICRPLGMDSTCITLSSNLQARLAQGHDDEDRPVKNWSQPLPGDGALRSSANDMLKFLSAEMGLTPSPLSEAITKTQIPRHAAEDATTQVALGWGVLGTNILWHNGGTSGYRCCICIDNSLRRVVVVLANSADDVDDLCAVLMGYQKYRKVARVDFGIYDQYVGQYSLPFKDPADSRRTVPFYVTRQDDHLLGRLKGQGKFEIFPESETRFFDNPDDIQIVFERNAEGVVTDLLIFQHGIKRKCAKVR